MPFEDTKILEFNHYQKSIIECIIEKIDGCKNNP